MLLGAKGTSRNRPKAGCFLALNLITATSINQWALLNLLLWLDRRGQDSRVIQEIWPLSQRQNRPAAWGPKGGLFPIPSDNWGWVERPCVSNHYISTPSFFHGDILALWTLVIRNHVAHLTLSLEPPIPAPPPLVFAVWGSTAGGEEGAGSLGALGCPVAQTDISTHRSHGVTQIPEFQKVGASGWPSWPQMSNRASRLNKQESWTLGFLQHYNCTILPFWKFSEISIPITNLGLTDF